MSNKNFWQMLKRPHKATLGTIIALGFLFGIGFWGSFNTVLEATNTEEFCISCHEMESNAYEEYKETIHYSNRSGVRATCPDCHVPDQWTHKIVRKIQATKEVWGKLTGIVNSKEKFNDHRKTMAIREWDRMKATDSRECRNCHNFEYMDFSEQGKRSRVQHTDALKDADKTCIDCHKGIAHKLPDMEDVEGWN